MQVICASICYRGFAEDEVKATLQNARGIGYRLMEIHGPMTWSVEAVDAFDLASIRQALDAAGMRCAGIYSPGWGGCDAEDVAEHARAIAQCARLARQLGGDHVTSTGASDRGEEGALERVADCVGRVLDELPDDTPVRLALEPHYGNALQQLDDFRRILKRFGDPRVGVCVDTGHFHSAGVDTVALIHELGPRIYNVHLKDHLGTESVGIGRGEIDLGAILEALRETGYAGDLTVELEVEDPQNLPRYTQEAYVYIKGLLGEKL